MTLRLAIDTLAGKTYTGIATSYDLDTLPPMLNAADLPALVPQLIQTRDKQDTQAMNSMTFEGTQWVATYHIEHVAYWIPVGQGRLAEFLPNMYTFINNYQIKVGGDGTLGGYLDKKLIIETLEIIDLPYPATLDNPKATRYWCVRILHRWQRYITGVA